jgi:hypothetical protein
VPPSEDAPVLAAFHRAMHQRAIYFLPGLSLTSTPEERSEWAALFSHSSSITSAGGFSLVSSWRD